MGIARGAVKLLVQEARRRSMGGRVLTLGKQDVSVTANELESIAAEFQFSLHSAQGIDPLSHKPEARAQGFISDIYLFTRLGFSECKSIDYSDYEGCDYVFDLNRSDLPSHLIASFDVIVDGGTVEHVFHLPNVLENLFKMVPLEGRIMHFSPSSNHIDHGFYMFSPTLFWDYYQINRFEINRFQIIRYSPWHYLSWKIWDYQPGCLNSVSYGGLDSGMYAIHCVVTKSKDSSAGIIPQQRNYLEGAWNGKNELIRSNAWWTMTKNLIKRSPFIYRALRQLVPFLRSRKGLKSKAVAKY